MKQQISSQSDFNLQNQNDRLGLERFIFFHLISTWSIPWNYMSSRMSSSRLRQVLRIVKCTLLMRMVGWVGGSRIWKWPQQWEDEVKEKQIHGREVQPRIMMIMTLMMMMTMITAFMMMMMIAIGDREIRPRRSRDMGEEYTCQVWWWWHYHQWWQW